MKINAKCSICGSTIKREIKVGDELKLMDGSGLSKGLHKILWNEHSGYRENDNEPFKPVRVIRVEGEMLAVLPVHWDDSKVRWDEQARADVYSAMSWCGPGYPNTCHDIFWIDVQHCSPILLKEEK